RCREALAGQGPATQDRPSLPRRALACRAAAQPQAAGGWRLIKWRRSMSGRERERFEAQKRLRSFVLVFSCGAVESRPRFTSADFFCEEQVFARFELLINMNRTRSSRQNL